MDATKSVADAVVSGTIDIKRSENPWDWLGHGSYFWEDSPTRARQWAVEEARKPNGKIKNPAVLGAVIHLGHCLNLVDTGALELVRAAYEGYRALCKATGQREAVNRGANLGARELDCAVMETLHVLRKEQGLPEFQTVRGFFVEGIELYPKAGFRSLDHVQICVRSPDQILGYFHPRI